MFLWQKKKKNILRKVEFLLGIQPNGAFLSGFAIAVDTCIVDHDLILVVILNSLVHFGLADL